MNATQITQKATFIVLLTQEARWLHKGCREQNGMQATTNSVQIIDCKQSHITTTFVVAVLKTMKAGVEL